MSWNVDHLSYSQLNQYETENKGCPRAYYLQRVKNAEPKQTWFFPIGTAVHRSIEHYLHGEEFNTKEIFYSLTAEQMKIDPNHAEWLAGGSLDDPTIGDKALLLAQQCVANAMIWLEDFDVWEIEYDATGMLPGCEVPIKAYIDVIGEHKKHGPAIVDWKSGKSKPKNNLQLETYRALLTQPSIYGGDHPFTEHGSMDFKGLWVMLHPDASKARPVDLSKVDPSALGARYQKLYEDVSTGKWQTNHGFHCKFCIMAPNCKLESGYNERTAYYDTAEQDGIPF